MGFLGWLRWVWESFLGWFVTNPASEIETGLWEGPTPKTLPKGIDAVLNVSQQQDAAAIINGLPNGQYAYLPIPDAGFPGIPWLAKAVWWVQMQRKEGHTVLVHCTEGHSRSGMVVVATLMQAHGWSFPVALAFARSKHPSCDPNPSFKQGLQQWETYLRTTRNGAA